MTKFYQPNIGFDSLPRKNLLADAEAHKVALFDSIESGDRVWKKQLHHLAAYQACLAAADLLADQDRKTEDGGSGGSYEVKGTDEKTTHEPERE